MSALGQTRTIGAGIFDHRAGANTPLESARCRIRRRRAYRRAMLALTDSQLQLVMAAAGGLSPEKRSLFLERIAARLRLRGGASLPWTDHEGMSVFVQQPMRHPVPKAW